MFNSCIVEGESQLLTKIKSWESAKTAEPIRREARKEFLQSKCDALFNEYEQKRESLHRQYTEAIKQQEQIERLASEIGTETALPTSPVSLNQHMCSL